MSPETKQAWYDKFKGGVIGAILALFSSWVVAETWVDSKVERSTSEVRMDMTESIKRNEESVVSNLNSAQTRIDSAIDEWSETLDLKTDALRKDLVSTVSLVNQNTQKGIDLEKRFVEMDKKWNEMDKNIYGNTLAAQSLTKSVDRLTEQLDSMIRE